MIRTALTALFAVGLLGPAACAEPAPPSAAPTPTPPDVAAAAPGRTDPLPSAPQLPGDLPREDIIRGVPDRVTGLSGDEPCDGFTLTAALFDPNTADLDPAVGEVLDLLTADLRAHPRQTTLEILGHTDTRPASFPGGNAALSQARAEAVRAALVERGIDPAAITHVAGLADRYPVDLGTDDQAHLRNRRVEVIVHCHEPGRAA